MGIKVATGIATIGAVIGLIFVVYLASQASAETVSRGHASDSSLHGAFELITERGNVGYIGG